MKCIDCKYCAYINDSYEDFQVTSFDDSQYTWGTIKGSYCMRIALIQYDVKECTGYQKSKYKKIKPFKSE